MTSGIAPYTGASSVFFGRFGTVRNDGSSTQADASTFIIELTFFVKNINANTNGKSIPLESDVYHSPGLRKYYSDLNFKVNNLG